MDSPYYSESELCGGVVMVSFSKYLPWQAIHFLQRSIHFSKTCCRPFAASFRRIVKQAVVTFHVRFSVSKALPPLENRSSLPPSLQLGISHRLPLHNSGALLPVHELFKRPSYHASLVSGCGRIVFVIWRFPLYG
jgi:hypothetical protein